MKRQFVTEVGVFAIAWKAKKAEALIAFVKRFEHALLQDDDYPAKVLCVKIRKLCRELDEKFPKTMPLQVDIWRGKEYGGMKSEISVKPTRRDGSFSDSYWVIIRLFDVKTDFDFSQDPVKSESLLVNTLTEEGGAL